MKKLAEMGLAKIGVAAGVGYLAGKQMRAGSSAMGRRADAVSARELELYMDNDQQIYRQIESVRQNLLRKVKSGKYNAALSVKLWMYPVEAGAKKYHAEFGSPGVAWHQVFDKSTREMVAREYVKQFDSDLKGAGSWQSLADEYGVRGEYGLKNRGRRAGSKKWDWQKNIFTGDYITNVDDHVQLLRMAGLEPPYLYWARERSGGREALTGPVESTPAKAVASLRRMMKEFGRARSKQMTKRQSFIVAEIVRESPPYLASDAVARYKAAIARGEGWIETSDAIGVADDFIRKAQNAWKRDR